MHNEVTISSMVTQTFTGSIQLVHPTSFGIRVGIAKGEVWFDVENGRAVQEIMICDMNLTSPDVEEPDTTQSNTVWSMR